MTNSDLVTRSDNRPNATVHRVRAWAQYGSLGTHALLLALVLLGVSLLTRPGDVWTSDEGAVRAQVEVLHTTGSWSAVRPFADIDPEGVLTPIHGASIEGDRYFPYTKQPLLPVLLTVARSIGGDGTMILWSLLGTLGCALAAALIAARVDAGIRNATLWIVGVFTPAFFYGFTVLGHTVAAACSGALVVFVLRHRDRRSPWWAAIALMGAVSALVRAEAVLFALAVAVAVVLDAHRRRRGLRMDLAVVIALPAVLAAVANARIDGALGGPTPEEGEAILDAFRVVSGAFSSLVLVDFGPPLLAAAVITTLAAAGLLAVAVVREPQNVVLHRVLFASGVLGVAGLALQMPAAIGGLLAATPFLACGLLVLPKGLRRMPDVSLIVVTSAIFALLVIATQERGGGGVQWGGRYLLPMLPALAPVAIASLVERRRAGPREVRWLWLLLGMASVVLAINAVWTLNEGRANSVLMVDRLVETAGVADPGADSLPVMVSVHTQIGRHAWRHLDDVGFLMIPEDRLDTYLHRFAASTDGGFAYFGALDDVRSVFRESGFVASEYRWYPYHIVRPDS